MSDAQQGHWCPVSLMAIEASLRVPKNKRCHMCVLSCFCPSLLSLRELPTSSWAIPTGCSALRTIHFCWCPGFGAGDFFPSRLRYGSTVVSRWDVSTQTFKAVSSCVILCCIEGKLFSLSTFQLLCLTWGVKKKKIVLCLLTGVKMKSNNV